MGEVFSLLKIFYMYMAAVMTIVAIAVSIVTLHKLIKEDWIQDFKDWHKDNMDDWYGRG